ncbi:GNAT family N-acetyltransferase [Marinobacter sp.]|uniref:GNAT family N-acetyltransferase n=1 Tax=Marinobacter sp. TaxID=50741 RepID=UPI002B27BE58|nr:GNAT family N-acetyltransferase [Marinobacter sp.]
MSLFQSNAWQKTWWEIWGSTPGFKLVMLGGRGRSGLYLDQYRWRSVVPIRCLQLVGTNYRRISTPRTEYNDLTSFHDGLDAKGELSGLSWSEAVFRDLIDSTPHVNRLRQLCRERGWLFRTVHQDTAYHIATDITFDDYLSSLGPNTRLRLFNRRKVLDGCGHITLENFWPNKVEHFFHRLNELHRSRWGVPCFGSSSLDFHLRFLSRIVDEGGRPELSVLCCDNEDVSLLYNVVYEGRVYNIQAGYIEGFHRKLALGTLHLGYCIETACSATDVDSFDLLAGEGKNENYKRRLANREVPMVSVMVVRGRLLKLLYRLKH